MCDWLCRWLEPAILIQCLIFIGLIWYACETWKLRKTSQEQNETMQKPCLVLSVEERDYFNAKLSQGGNNAGDKKLSKGKPNQYLLRNIGNGPALNVRYEVQYLGESKAQPAHSYLPYVSQLKQEGIYLSSSEFNETSDSEITLSYGSLGKRCYESKIRIHRENGSLVAVDFRFRETTPRFLC